MSCKVILNSVIYKMIDDILFEFKPLHWKNTDYSNKRYALVQIGQNDDEYYEVTKQFNNYKIITVERVQHPYALGYYILRKKQLNNRGQYMYEETRYHPVSPVDKETALEYNLDVRRYKVVHNVNVSGVSNNPQLYKKVHKLISQYDTFIVCKILVDESDINVPVIVPSYESEYMPEYIVKVLSTK